MGNPDLAGLQIAANLGLFALHATSGFRLSLTALPCGLEFWTLTKSEIKLSKTAEHHRPAVFQLHLLTVCQLHTDTCLELRFIHLFEDVSLNQSVLIFF